MASKRLCVRQDGYLRLSQDEWSHIMTFVCTQDAWTSALDMASMSQTCRAWHDLTRWQYWAEAFRVFPLGKEFPTVLYPCMRSAIENRGFVTQTSAMGHLKLNASALKNVPHNIISLRRRRYKYLYKIDDVLRVATAKYGCIAALEQHVQKCANMTAARQRTKEIKQTRREQIVAILKDVGAPSYVMDNKSVEKYMETGVGCLEEIRELALRKKKMHDEKAAREAEKATRRDVVKQCARSVGLSCPHLYQRNAVITRYIQDGIGTKETVTQSCLEEKQALDERRRLSEQNRAPRRAQLIAELQSHGLSLRPDSRFCSQYITGETNASLQEVVATMKLTAFLFSRGHRTWSNWHNVLEGKMKARVRSGESPDWYAACQHVMHTHQHLDEDSDDDSYY